jgi:uncharacterized protein (TIGR02147 family)
MDLTRPDLLEYTDLPTFLAAWLAFKAREEPGYDRARLATDLSDTGLDAVLDGDAPPSDALIDGLIAGLALSPSEAGYLRLLAATARATDPEHQEQAAAACERYRDYHRIEWVNDEAGLRALFSSYAARVVLALAELPGFQADPEYIATHTFPPIDIEEAAEALNALLSLGALQPTPEGRIGPSTDRLKRFHAPRPASRADRLSIGRQHLRMLHDAEVQALEVLESPDRLYASLMVPVPASQLEQLQARLLEEVEALARRAQQDPNPDAIVLVDLRMFTVARSD